MNETGWFLLGLALLALLIPAGVIGWWTWSLSRAIRRRGDVPKESALPSPLPLPAAVRADLFARPPRRKKTDPAPDDAAPDPETA